MLVNQKGMMVLPSSIQAIPAPNLEHLDIPLSVISEPLETTQIGENLRLYHAQLDLLESIYHPDQSDLDWQIEDIKTWQVRKHKSLDVIFLLVVWIGGD